MDHQNRPGGPTLVARGASPEGKVRQKFRRPGWGRRWSMGWKSMGEPKSAPPGRSESIGQLISGLPPRANEVDSSGVFKRLRGGLHGFDFGHDVGGRDTKVLVKFFSRG